MNSQLYGQKIQFTILHTSDEHSNLLPLPLADYHPEKPNPSIGGFARLSTLVNEIRMQKADQPVLLLSSGDFIGGSPFAWLILEGFSPEIEIMKKIGYNAVTIGNHEFDYGPDILLEYLQRVGYPNEHSRLPIVASNLNIPQDEKLQDANFPESHIISLSEGLQIGIVGILGIAAYDVAPYADPVQIHSPIQSAQNQVQKLRQAGADLIIALSHSGIVEDRQLATEVSGIDIILGGHDHITTPSPEIINNTIILHSGNYLSTVGQLEIAIDKATGKLMLLNDEYQIPYQLPLDSTIDEDPEIAQMIEEYEVRLNLLISSFTGDLIPSSRSVVMQSDYSVIKHAEMVETTVGNFVTDAMRLMAQQVSGERVDIALQANGVIRGDIIPGTMEWSRGDITFLDLATIAGLGSGPDLRPGYPMVSFYLTEKEIFNVLEIASLLSQIMGDTYFLQFSGLRYTYDPGKAKWLKIPFANIPVPAYRSVQSAELFAGEGVQTPDGPYTPLDKNSEQLYHLVSDYYLTSFLPMIGDILPRLRLVLKDKNGDPLPLENTIIQHQNHEFKVWEAVARYAVSFDKNEHGISVIPPYYQDTQQRIVITTGIPLYIWSWTIIILLLLGIVALIRWSALKIIRRMKR